MAENKHTPGPWTKVRGELVGSNGEKVVEYGSGVAIMCGGPDPESVANAALRNAAPDLLTALIDARRQLEAYEREATGETYNSVEINAAIAKAKGEQ